MQKASCELGSNESSHVQSNDDNGQEFLGRREGTLTIDLFPQCEFGNVLAV
jgi:hypothetical protein